MSAAVDAGRKMQTSVAIANPPNTTVTQTVESPENATPNAMSSVSTTGLRLHRLQRHRPYAQAPSATA